MMKPFAIAVSLALVSFAVGGNSVALAATGDWYQTLLLAEKQIDEGKIEGAYSYVAAIQKAEAAKVRCSDQRFVDLMSVGSNMFAPLYALKMRGTNVAPVIESALKWKEHAATAVCGAKSGAYYAACRDLSGFYMSTGKSDLGISYLSQVTSEDALTKSAELKRFEDAAQARWKLNHFPKAK